MEDSFCADQGWVGWGGGGGWCGAQAVMGSPFPNRPRTSTGPRPGGWGPQHYTTPGVKAETEEAVHTVTQEMSVDPPTAQEIQGNADTPVETPQTAEICSPAPVVQTVSEAKEASPEPGNIHVTVVM